ncbi:hypothetical protein ACLMJK_009219 [Lecanora helva]
MTGRRLLDAAVIFSAARGVASKHVALRGQQLDAFNKTSTLARAAKSQTDRITLTVKAASALAGRFNEPSPRYSTQASQTGPPDKSPSSQNQNHAEKPNGTLEEKQGLAQDHFYRKSSENSTAESPPKDDLEIKQEKARRPVLQDGSVPPTSGESDISRQDEDPFYDVPKPDRMEVFEEKRQDPHDNTATRLPRRSENQIPVEVAEPTPVSTLNPGAPAATEKERAKLNVAQEQEVFYTPSLKSNEILSDPSQKEALQKSGVVQESKKGQTVPEAQAGPEQEELPEESYSELFQSSKVAKMLRGQSRSEAPQEHLELRGARSIPVKATKAPQDKDQVSSSTRTPAQPGSQTSSSPEQKFVSPAASEQRSNDDVHDLAANIAKDTESNSSSSSETSEALDQDVSKSPYQMRESRVPSSRFGRIWQYGGLAASMTMGAVGESLRRATGRGDSGSSSPLMLSASNMERLVAKLSRMRGAALKLGQMMSFQDSKMLPGPINEVLQRVQDSADYMPASQRNQVLASNLGADWRDLFSSFDEKPIAAASIGQVHKATLKSSGQQVAIKVQYPGVANSIDSDLSNISILLTASRLLPKGLYLDKTIANARTELAWECDYTREAEMGSRFRHLLADEPSTFHVPAIIKEASGPQVLTAEFCPGTGVTKIQAFTQDQKDWIGTHILRLCLREITEFKFMQTDPNWTNFLYNASSKKLELLDFGASREYPDKFIDPYIRTLQAASRSDRATVRDLSIELGYLTGHESKAMRNAHVDSVLTLAEPFMESAPEVYDFRDQTITDRVRGLIPVMVRERLAPPPEETYSLHRKLSGAFLLCARLGSRVRCRELFARAMEKAGMV